ncbi:HDOD domain-containing protein [Erythrobacter sp. NE805]|uniref:HDOD domain-containing protein n=1 Tax=Erythrobacter sp. NE805 TaxID=3389875 RepID=UPI00396AF0C4
MTQHPLPPLPDPSRFGGPGWLARSGGVMTGRECARGLAIASRSQVQNLWQRMLPFLQRPGRVDDLPPVPDSKLVQLAEEAALAQSRALLAHGYRSAIFARALAHIDGHRPDPELLHICGLLHDVGLMKDIAGEDFTLRSAAAARQCACDAHQPEAVGDHLADALIVHTTIGVTPARDGVLGAYTQYGAMVDLTGLRLAHLPKDFVTGVLREHPRGAFKAELIRRLEKEAKAVPGGRFAFAVRVGFGLAVKQAPFPS